MHSQGTELLSRRLVYDEGLRLMLAASLDHKAGSECVSVHSMDMEGAGLLSYKYRWGQQGGSWRRAGVAHGGCVVDLVAVCSCGELLVLVRVCLRGCVALLASCACSQRHACTSARQGCVKVSSLPQSGQATV
jgi:hypothetical protein